MPAVPPTTRRVQDAAAREGVEIEVVQFDQSTHTAQDAARALGADVGQIVKSLVFVAPREDGLEPLLVLASGANTVDIALLTAALAEPGIRRATADEARELTGYAIGGIPPFGHSRPIRTLMDPDLAVFETVWAAAGTPNAVFGVAPATLRSLAGAIVTPIARNSRRVDEKQPAEASPGA